MTASDKGAKDSALFDMYQKGAVSIATLTDLNLVETQRDGEGAFEEELQTPVLQDPMSADDLPPIEAYCDEEAELVPVSSIEITPWDSGE